MLMDVDGCRMDVGWMLMDVDGCWMDVDDWY